MEKKPDSTLSADTPQNTAQVVVQPSSQDPLLNQHQDEPNSGMIAGIFLLVCFVIGLAFMS